MRISSFFPSSMKNSFNQSICEICGKPLQADECVECDACVLEQLSLNATATIDLPSSTWYALPV